MSALIPASNRLRFADPNLSAQPLAGAPNRLRRMLSTVGELLSICSRGLIAAHHYERLKSQSDTDLAAIGLQRSDVPRAAFQKLTEKS